MRNSAARRSFLVDGGAVGASAKGAMTVESAIDDAEKALDTGRIGDAITESEKLAQTHGLKKDEPQRLEVIVARCKLVLGKFAESEKLLAKRVKPTPTTRASPSGTRARSTATARATRRSRCWRTWRRRMRCRKATATGRWRSSSARRARTTPRARTRSWRWRSRSSCSRTSSTTRSTSSSTSCRRRRRNSFATSPSGRARRCSGRARAARRRWRRTARARGALRPSPTCARARAPSTPSRSTNVVLPASRSLPGSLPSVCRSAVMSRTSSTIWKASPSARPYTVSRSIAAASAPPMRAPARTATSKQLAGLGAMQRLQLVDGDLLAGGLDVDHLPADHADRARGARQLEHHVGDALFAPGAILRGDAERLGAQRVAGEDGHRLAELLVRRRPPATEVVVVHRRQIVVDERIGVHELDGAGGVDRVLGLAAHRLARRQRQDRAQPLAAGHERVVHRLAQRRRRAVAALEVRASARSTIASARSSTRRDRTWFSRAISHVSRGASQVTKPELLDATEQREAADAEDLRRLRLLAAGHAQRLFEQAPLADRRACRCPGRNSSISPPVGLRHAELDRSRGGARRAPRACARATARASLSPDGRITARSITFLSSRTLPGQS